MKTKFYLVLKIEILIFVIKWINIGNIKNEIYQVQKNSGMSLYMLFIEFIEINKKQLLVWELGVGK